MLFMEISTDQRKTVDIQKSGKKTCKFQYQSQMYRSAEWKLVLMAKNHQDIALSWPGTSWGTSITVYNKKDFSFSMDWEIAVQGKQKSKACQRFTANNMRKEKAPWLMVLWSDGVCLEQKGETRISMISVPMYDCVGIVFWDCSAASLTGLLKKKKKKKINE